MKRSSTSIEEIERKRRMSIDADISGLDLLITATSSFASSSSSSTSSSNNNDNDDHGKIPKLKRSVTKTRHPRHYAAGIQLRESVLLKIFKDPTASECKEFGQFFRGELVTVIQGDCSSCITGDCSSCIWDNPDSSMSHSSVLYSSGDTLDMKKKKSRQKTKILGGIMETKANNGGVEKGSHQDSIRLELRSGHGMTLGAVDVENSGTGSAAMSRIKRVMLYPGNENNSVLESLIAAVFMRTLLWDTKSVSFTRNTRAYRRVAKMINESCGSGGSVDVDEVVLGQDKLWGIVTLAYLSELMRRSENEVSNAINLLAIAKNEQPG